MGEALSAPQEFYTRNYCCIFLFYRSEIGFASPTAMSMLRLYFDIRVNFTGLFFIFDMRYGDMDDALGDAHLHRLPRRFVRASPSAGSSSPPLIRTPSPASPIVVSPRAYSA